MQVKLFYDILVFLGDLLPEIGVHVLDALLLAGDIVVVNVADLGVKKERMPPVNCHGFLLVGARGPLHLNLGVMG